MKKLGIFNATFLALPLSFVSIPIYLNIADFYSNKFGLNLIIIGALLAFVRIFDALQDPFIGYYSDVLHSKTISRKKIIRIFSLILCIGFFLVFNPPFLTNKILIISWFFLSLCCTYLCFNFVVINFESLIALISKNDEERILLNSVKEFLGLIGIILAFAIPGILIKNGLENKYFYLTVFFVIFVLFAIYILLPKVRIPQELFKTSSSSKTLILEKKSQIKQYLEIFFNKNILKDNKFVNFLLIFFLNSTATSLPAANMNFYVREILRAEESLSWFLSTYFISACLFIPLWRFLFTKFGILKSWILSICGAIITFAFAYFLNSGNSSYFYIICLLSGMFLGADLIAPPIILAKITKDKNDIISSYFALWNFSSKIGLMIAASGSLIILGFFDYKPGNSITHNLNIIVFFYAILPCIIKLFVVKLLLKFRKYEN